MTIPIGTLCLLLPPNSFAGEFCTVVGPLSYTESWNNSNQSLGSSWNYEIELGVTRPCPGFDGDDDWVWCATHAQLLPVAPPQKHVAEWDTALA